VFGIINIFIEKGEKKVKEGLVDLINPIIKIMDTSEDPNILEKGAICLKNFLKFTTEADKIHKDQINKIINNVKKLLLP